MQNISIVGAGVGGLTTGIYLQSEGYQVTIYEKNDHPGGKMDTIQADGFKFDTGPTIVMMPDIYKKPFADTGVNDLDRGWTDHNAFLSELREGIHLRFLGRRDPLDEFNREAVPVFKGFLDEARSRAAETFEGVRVHDGQIDVGEVGVKRPSMTWTYMVHDHPFSSPIETLAGKLKGSKNG